MVSLTLVSAVLVLEVNFTDGCEVLTELSFVQAAKQIAMVKADNVNVVIFFTFVLFNIPRVISTNIIFYFLLKR